MNGSLSAIIVRVLLLCALVALSSGYYLAYKPSKNGLLPIKKSQIGGLVGSRNCYFSPVSCVITRDVSAYRKLAGPS
ncbi:hypothetical protein RB195_017717 [Necator americanus]